MREVVPAMPMQMMAGGSFLVGSVVAMVRAGLMVVVVVGGVFV